MVSARDLTKLSASNARTMNGSEALPSNVHHVQYLSLSQQKTVNKHSSLYRQPIAVQKRFGLISDPQNP